MVVSLFRLVDQWSYSFVKTDLIKDAAHPVEENLEEVALKERHVQVTLLKRLRMPPPVPPLADTAVVPELRKTKHSVFVQ